jgi:APA family basic amino acid/polyamine antiporter
MRSVFTGATVVFFAYVGFDAVANSAEESKKPQVCCCLLPVLYELSKCHICYLMFLLRMINVRSK